jgi:hypothetical protein
MSNDARPSIFTPHQPASMNPFIPLKPPQPTPAPAPTQPKK